MTSLSLGTGLSATRIAVAGGAPITPPPPVMRDYLLIDGGTFDGEALEIDGGTFDGQGLEAD